MQDSERLKHAAAAVALFALALWAIRIAEVTVGPDLGVLGVRPGEPWGLVGVVTAPLVHGSFGHLLSNTPPLLFLGTLMLYGYPRASRLALPLIWLGSGLAVWLFARASAHIGISGVNLGMLVFLFVAGILRRDRPAVALALAAAFLYGGMIWGVLPLRPEVSFESHLAGALAGLVAAFLFRRVDPVPERARYDWEDQIEAELDEPGDDAIWQDGAAPPWSAQFVEPGEIVPVTDDPAEDTWPEHLRAYLERQAAEGRTVSYDQASQELGIEPPQRIHKLAEALERSMAEDAEAGRALRAAVVVSKTGSGMPQRGFFRIAGELGRYHGPETGEPAAEFHARELSLLQRELGAETDRPGD